MTRSRLSLLTTCTTSLTLFRSLSSAFTPVVLPRHHHLALPAANIYRSSAVLPRHHHLALPAANIYRSYYSTTTTTTLSNTASSNMESYKRAKLDDTKSDKVVGTHSGTFQADEAMGVWMLRQLCPYRNANLVRTRDPKVLEGLDIVIDVGGVYDHSILRYDHHQRGYDERFDSGRVANGQTQDGGRCTKMSASGLVYRHYGKQVIQTFYPHLSESDLELVYTNLYDSLMEALDAIDTGVEPVPDGVEMLYKDSTGLAARVGRLNPRWNEVDPNGEHPPCPDARFEQASALCGEDFLATLTRIVESDLPARAFVEKALLKRDATDSSGEIIAFESGGMPWKKHLYELEREHNLDTLIKFVLYTDQAGMWRVQAVTVEGKQFENRLGLPKEWRGVRDAELAAISKIPGCKFCHAAGFIGGAETYEGALAMAKEGLTRKED